MAVVRSVIVVWRVARTSCHSLNLAIAVAMFSPCLASCCCCGLVLCNLWTWFRVPSRLMWANSVLSVWATPWFQILIWLDLRGLFRFWFSVIVTVVVIHSCCLDVMVTHSCLLDIIHVIIGVLYWVFINGWIIGDWISHSYDSDSDVVTARINVTCIVEAVPRLGLAVWFKSYCSVYVICVSGWSTSTGEGGVSMNQIAINLVGSSSSYGSSNQSQKNKPVGDSLAIVYIRWMASSVIGTIVRSFLLLSKVL